MICEVAIHTSRPTEALNGPSRAKKSLVVNEIQVDLRVVLKQIIVLHDACESLFLVVSLDVIHCLLCDRWYINSKYR